MSITLFANAEGYGLGFSGWAKALREAETPPVGPLVPQPERSLAWDNTGNLLVEGDNLDTLKNLLLDGYEGSVKCIYIDPPYNTRSQLVYNDDFKKGRDFHSEWLAFMLPRLLLGRRFLSDEGIIFLSIDDYEVHNLRILCEYVFGESNYVGTMVRRRRTGANDPGLALSKDHEYVLIFRKTKFGTLRGADRTTENYDNPDNDPMGPWCKSPLTVSKTYKQQPTRYYPIVNPETGQEHWCSKDRVWRFARDRMEKFVADGRIIFPPPNRPGVPYLKRFVSERRSEWRPVSTWMPCPTEWDGRTQEDDGTLVLPSPLNAEATRETKALLGFGFFDFPKPVGLVRSLIGTVANEPGDVVMDFFGGSGTTAHAVMDLSGRDGVRRNYILCQLDAPTEYPEFPTIADMTRLRITRAAEELRGERSGLLNFEGDGEEPDYGFRSYRIEPRDPDADRDADTAHIDTKRKEDAQYALFN